MLPPTHHHHHHHRVPSWWPPRVFLLVAVGLCCLAPPVRAGWDKRGSEWPVAGNFAKGTPADPGTSSSGTCFQPFTQMLATDLFGSDCTTLSTTSCLKFAKGDNTYIEDSCSYSSASTNSANIVARLAGTGDSGYYFRLRGGDESYSFFYPSSERWWAPEVRIGGGDVLCQLEAPTLASGNCLTAVSVYANFSRTVQTYDEFNHTTSTGGYSSEGTKIWYEYLRTTGCTVAYTSAACSSASGITLKIFTARCKYTEEHERSCKFLMQSTGIWIVGLILDMGPCAWLIWPFLPMCVGLLFWPVGWLALAGTAAGVVLTLTLPWFIVIGLFWVWLDDGWQSDLTCPYI